MDTFFEQIVPIRKTGATLIKLVLIWIAAFVVCTLLFLILPYAPAFSMIIFLAIAGALYGAFKLSSLLNVEYEYILTNGEMDFDKITARSSRKRALSFNCSDILRIEKYNPAAPAVVSDAKTEIYCNTTDENACFIIINHSKRGKLLVVFAPDEHMKSGMSVFVPRIIAGDFFK